MTETKRFKFVGISIHKTTFKNINKIAKKAKVSRSKVIRHLLYWSDYDTVKRILCN